ncbi:maleylpyruvate isomerase N-terminal domain-containing protein [Streptomyces sp. NPDC093248]|uniref:maleylpyruvate isomerase N-terminal domain-containing protein n=1 Tax=Streptomyces sp. NPDC093248 TaxID=3155072 RepID=UPI003435F372
MLNYNLAVPDVDDAGVLPALVAEGDELDVLVRAVDDWSIPTPAAGWTVAHQIAHLAWADANVLSALRTPDAFEAELERAEVEGSAYADRAAAAGAAKPRSVILDEWRAGRAELAEALRDTPSCGRSRRRPRRRGRGLRAERPCPLGSGPAGGSRTDDLLRS